MPLKVQVVDVIEPLASPSMRDALGRAIAGGIVGVALLDRDGTIVGLAGDIPDDEARLLAEFVMMRANEAAPELAIGGRHRRLAARLFAGEILVERVAGRDVAVGIAGKQLFVVAVLGGASRELVESLCDELDAMLVRDDGEQAFVPPHGGSGGSGPDNLALIEFGITVPRAKA